MTTPLEPRPDREPSLFRDYAPITCIFLAVLLITRPEYLGDTYGYVQAVLKFDRGGFPPSGNPLWEFGHLFWRPAGWLFFKLFGPMMPYLRSGEPNLAATTAFIMVTLLSALVCVLVTQWIALRVSGRRSIATLVSSAFLSFYAFLDYDRTGNAYVCGLMFLLLALWLTIRAADRGGTGWRQAILPAIVVGCATLIWFPYILAIPGLLAVILWWNGAKRREMIPSLIAFATLTVIAGYTVAVIQLRITSVETAVAWIRESSHGWSQSHRLVRMISGLPRSFLSMRDDGMILKRFYVKDPYAPVTLLQLLAHLAKPAAFYAFLLALFWALWRGSRRLLAILVASAVPILLFAAFVFESGSPERYFPIYPFLCMAMASALGDAKAPRLAKYAVAGFAMFAIALNVTLLSAGVIEARTRKDAARALSLHGKVNDQGVVALVTIDDGLYQFAASFPFDPVNRQQSLPIYDVVEIGTTRVLTWKQEFASRAIKAIDLGGAVWISKRILAEHPEPGWRWTEGDDRRIAWKDLAPVFRQFTYSEETGGADGFLKLDPSGPNRKMLESLQEQTVP